MKKTTTSDTVLNVLLYREDDVIFAHCLECDLLAHGKTARTAVKRLIGVIETQLEVLAENGCPEKFHRPAPEQYWLMLKDAVPIATIRMPKKREKDPELPKRLPLHEMARLNFIYKESLTPCRD